MAPKNVVTKEGDSKVLDLGGKHCSIHHSILFPWDFSMQDHGTHIFVLELASELLQLCSVCVGVFVWFAQMACTGRVLAPLLMYCRSMQWQKVRV